MGPAALPSGLVTFVITDIEGSTRLLKTLGETYEVALAEHHRRLRDVWAAHDGAEVNTEGDSFIVAFGDATDAVLACAAAQETIDATDWGEHPFRIRIGVHCGPAHPRDGDYVSLALHQTARVEGCANGRQTVVSEAVHTELDHARLDDRLTTHSAGRFRLRDFDTPVELFMVEPIGWTPETVPLRALPAEHHNLAIPPSPRFDRIDELARLAELVEPGVLTTLWGPGGVGKTRLATEFGRDHARDWTDGIWMVPLATVATPGELIGAVATTMGISLTGDSDPGRRLIGRLTGLDSVMILDNCEHLAVPVAMFVEQLRTQCPTVSVLATSRAPLGMRGERRLQVEPFPSVEPDGGIGPSVEMFRLRASDVAGSSDDIEAVGELCDRLDGLPLAIELAAARSDTMTPSQMLAGLDRRLRSLRLPDPGLPERHQSIDATIDWSYELLSPTEQTALRRLTVFRSSFGIESAAAACDLDEVDAAEVVWSLVSSSVVVRDTSVGDTRFRLYSTVRARVRELTGDDELHDAAARIAAHFDASVGPGVPRDLGWSSRAQLDLANLRELIDPEAGVDDPTRMRLLWSVGMLHDVKDEFALAVEQLDRSVSGTTETPELVGVLTLLADVHLRLGDLSAASTRLTAARSLADRLGPASWDPGGIARTEGEIALRNGDDREAERIAREALDEGITGQPAARLWNLCGLALATREDMEGAVEAFSEELRIWEALRDDATVAVAQGNLAEALLRTGDTAGAARHQLLCLEHALDVGRPLLVAFSTTVAAHLAGEQDDWQTSLELQGVSDVLLERAEYALYDFDRRARTELIRRATAEVGENASTWLAAGRTLGVVDAASRASQVLSGVASKHEEEPGERAPGRG